MAVSAAEVKRLREATQAPMMACKQALEDAEGDFDAAVKLVRERTGAKMDARAAERTADDGLVHTYLHTPTPDAPAKVGVMLELHCETDFVARNEQFRQLAGDLAMHIAAMRPEVVAEEDVDPDALAEEERLARKQAEEAGKPDHVIEQIVEGKVGKFYEETVLLNQPFVKDDSKTVGELVSEVQAVVGEKITVGRFARFEI